MIYKFGNKEFDFSKNCFIMGILNITPDSFFDGGKYFNFDAAFKHAIELAQNGADIIDVGGESSRPGSEQVSVQEELDRVIPVITKLKDETDIVISIDTTKSKVAKEAVNSGAMIVNDISGMTFDSDMIKIVSELETSVIISHIKGIPKTMQENPVYENVIDEINLFFKERIEKAVNAEIKQIILDPGIGFGKNLAHNLKIMNNISSFKKYGYPLLLGPSRKRFIGEIIGSDPESRLFGTASSVAICIYNGADIIRVHDVKEMKQVAMIAYNFRGERSAVL